MKRIHYLVFLILISKAYLYGQGSSIKITLESISEVMTPGTNEITLLATIRVSDPNTLKRAEVSISAKDNQGWAASQYFFFFVKDNRAFMSLGKYDLPFTNGIIQIPITVKDRFKEPSHKIIIVGYDIGDKPTNIIEYTRVND
jgi:hypothetical protein